MGDIDSSLNVSVSDDLNGYLWTIDSDGEANVKSKIWDGSNEAHIQNNKLKTTTNTEYDTNNSTTTPLGISGVFTGTATDLQNYTAIIVTTYADEDSATDGLKIEWSTDGTNWDGDDVYTVPGDKQKTYTFQTVARYFRIVYTNGTTAQSVFRLQVQLKGGYSKSSTHRIQEAITNDDDGEVTVGVMFADNGTNFRPVRFDSSTRALQVMSYEHHEVHAGSHYFISSGDELSLNEEIDYVFQTPDITKQLHFLYEWNATEEIKFYIYEDVTASGGTTITPTNNNRNSSNTSDAIVTKDGTVSGGNLIDFKWVGDASIGGQSDRNNEIILERNTKYLFRIQSKSSSNPVNWRFSWYEHTPNEE